jgi:hypothetical protein
VGRTFPCFIVFFNGDRLSRSADMFRDNFFISFEKNNWIAW